MAKYNKVIYAMNYFNDTSSQATISLNVQIQSFETGWWIKDTQTTHDGMCQIMR